VAIVTRLWDNLPKLLNFGNNLGEDMSRESLVLATIIMGSMLLFSGVSSTVLLTQQAAATTTQANHFRMYWTTARCSNEDSCNEMRDFTNSVLDGSDYVIFHYGSGQTPQKYQIDALKGVTSMGDARMGLEFFSLAELQRHAPTVKANGFGFISYDLERGASPASEVNDPVNSVRKARAIADANDLYLQLAPSNAISNSQYADDIGKITNRHHLQSQILQDDDTSCAKMDSWVAGRVRVLEGAKSILEGKITFQVSLNPDLAASGKTIFQTAKTCIDRIANDDVDGLSIWWTSSSWDDETYQNLVRYYERTYS
jgi:hypothetical protein